MSVLYILMLCVCGWRVAYRAMTRTRTRGTGVRSDALLGIR